jgi:hypothetical protein
MTPHSTPVQPTNSPGQPALYLKTQMALFGSDKRKLAAAAQEMIKKTMFSARPCRLRRARRLLCDAKIILASLA